MFDDDGIVPLNVRISKEDQNPQEEEWSELEINVDDLIPKDLISRLVHLVKDELNSTEITPIIFKLNKYYDEYKFQENDFDQELLENFAHAIHKLFYNKSYMTQIIIVKLLNCLIEYRNSSAISFVRELNNLFFYTNLVNRIIDINKHRRKQEPNVPKSSFLNLRPFFKLWANLLMYQEYKFFDSVESISENMQFMVNFFLAPYAIQKEQDIILLWIKRFASKIHSGIALDQFLEIFNQIPSDPYIMCHTLRGLLTSQQALRCLYDLNMLDALNNFLENPPDEKVLITAIQCVGSFYSHCISNEIDSVGINVDIIMQYAHDISNVDISEVALKTILKIVRNSLKMTMVFISRDLLELLSDVFEGGATKLQYLCAKIINIITSKQESFKIITSQPDFIMERLLPIDALIIQSCDEDDMSSIFGALNRIFNDKYYREDYYHVFIENGGREGVESLSESSNIYSGKAKKFLEFLDYIEDQIEG